MKIFFSILIGCFIQFTLIGQKPSKYSLNEGQKFSVTTSVDQTITQELPNQGSQVITSKISNVDEYEVIKKESNGNYTIKSTATLRKSDLDIAGQVMSFDSGVEGGQNLIYQKMVGKSFTFTMSQFGEILSLSGLDELAISYTNDLKGSSYEAFLEQLLKMYEKELVKSSLSGLFDVYPENANAEEWKDEGTIVLNDMALNSTSTYIWDSDETILKASDVDFEGTVKAQGMEVVMSMKGTVQTIIDLDKTNGLSTMQQGVYETKGTAKIMGMDIPQTIKMTNKVVFSNK